MQLCFQNSHGSPLSTAVMWYNPGACGGDGGNWETRGWWKVDPGDTVHTNVWTDNRYFCFYAEAEDGRFWSGQFVTEISIYAFDGCYAIAHAVFDTPSPYFDVGMRLVDTGWWSWAYVTYTVNLL
jgi:hypothetical protein